MTRSSSLFGRGGGGGNSDNATMVDHDGDRPLPAVRSVDNFDALARDLRFLAGMPELCDVTFLVGENRTPLHGVRAILAIRSRIFYKLLFGPKSAMRKCKLAQAGGGSPMSRRIQKMFSFSTNRSSTEHPMSPTQSCAATDSLKTVVYIDEFEADVFKQLLEYIHTGSTVLDASTVVGLMNAADHFSLNDLRRACFDFANSCIRCDTVCALLTAAEKYIQYKSTKVLMQKVLEFIDRRAEQILALGDFVHLPEHIVQLIISRDDLNASELTKYRAVERWTLNAVQSSSFSSSSSSGQPLCQLTLLRRFAQHIAFHEIPASVLMAEIRPLQIVPDAELMAALAFQADPTSLPPKEGFARTPKSQRRLTVCFSPITFDNRSLSTATALAEEEGESAGSDHGSSGYESLGSGGSCIIAKDGKTLVHIDSIVTEIHPKSKSVTDLSFVPIDYKV